jgi:hypothetical protein
MSDNTPDDSETCCVCLDKFNKVDNETKYDGIYGPKIDDNLGYTHNCSHYKQICINCQNKIIKQNNNNCPLCREKLTSDIRCKKLIKIKLAKINLKRHTRIQNKIRVLLDLPVLLGEPFIESNCYLIQLDHHHNINNILYKHITKYYKEDSEKCDVVISNPPYN